MIELSNKTSNDSISLIIWPESSISGKFIKDLKSNVKFFIIGYMGKVIKDAHDSYKSSGCDLILSKASLFKNIDSLVTEILNQKDKT